MFKTLNIYCLKLLERLINFLILNHLQAPFLRITLLYNQSIGGIEQEIVSEISTSHPDYILLTPSHFVCPLFYFEMSQNIILFLKIRVINLLMFLLYPYLLMFLLIIQFFDQFI